MQEEGFGTDDVVAVVKSTNDVVGVVKSTEEEEDQVEKFVDEICRRYISVWSKNFPDRHRNDPIGDQVAVL